MAIKVQHINATEADIQGNHGIGRYFFLTGSDGRARQISEMFINRVEKLHPRQHNLYMGQIENEHGERIDVASISTGMGGPSADIIINELVMLGAKRLLRVGTSGSLHPNHIQVGDLVVATGAVRDDKASWDYIYPEFPAMASYEYVAAAKMVVAKNLIQDKKVHFGVVHSKSSLFAREYQFSLLRDSKDYMDTIRDAGVLATEMECAQFFTLAPVLTARMNKTFEPQASIFCGAILAIIGDESGFASDPQEIIRANERSIRFAIETTIQLHDMDKKLQMR
ncbi:MAG: uridine phosphorylase [Gammaproteobacteria bacterium]|nr:uridine phosphorylase [Gammaproteobacteria bacterium]